MKIISHHRKNPALSMLDIARIEGFERKIAGIIEAAQALYDSGLTNKRGASRKPHKPRFNTSRAVAAQVAAAEERQAHKKLPDFIESLTIGGEPWKSDASHSTAEKWAARLQQVYGPCFHCEPKGTKVLVSRVAESAPAPIAMETQPVDDVAALRASIRADALEAGVDARELAP
jgi:hypothetical protein